MDTYNFSILNKTYFYGLEIDKYYIIWYSDALIWDLYTKGLDTGYLSIKYEEKLKILFIVIWISY